MAQAGNRMTVGEGYANQVAYCRENDASVTARAVAALAALVASDEPGAFWERIRDWPGSPLGDGLPLRSAGALHGLYLSGKAPQLAPIYTGAPADDAAIVAGAVREHEDFMLPWLDGPPQTNEAGRSSNFIAAELWLADQGLPARFECLEIGSSAGINLMIERYSFDLGGVRVGPDSPVMSFAPEWRGPPPPDRAIAIAALRGCDVAPLDLTDPEQVLRLRAYIWPEHAVRFARLDAAVASAKSQPPDLVRQGAADFVEEQLALPQEPGTTRLLMHSIVWQYLPEDEQSRITRAMEAHGREATDERALAWVALESNRDLLNHGLSVRYWPGDGEPQLLAAAHAHGAWVEWFGG
ncbi:MAG: DUF2332 domain-containing protein [Novosphingobium sp.]|nr:DUF2332 domain-containing protein [Novosphingobium sp.]MCP5402809.1 DUF2332 domain-containing protein [Novosphingobium sp.]